MKIIITERQLNLIERVIDNEVFCDKCNWNWSLDDGGNDPYICHKCGHDNTPEAEPNVFTYTTSDEWTNQFRPLDPKRIYFNGLTPINFDSSIPVGKIRLTKVNDSSQTFLINKDEFKQQTNKSGVLKSYVTLNYFNSLPQTKSATSNMLNPEKIITSIIIRSALESTFNNYWLPKDEVYSSGLRGIYKLGDYLTPKTDDDWSVLNYFDTKKEVKKMIYDELLNHNLPLNDLENSISKLFKDKMFMDTLVKRQLSSIVNGANTERKFIKKLSNILNSDDVKLYPFGSMMDRYNGVDVTINGLNYQIKPLKKHYIDNNGDYVVKTYGMKIDYLKKPIDKIVFSNNKEILIFDNKNYTVPFSDKVIFKEEPIIYK